MIKFDTEDPGKMKMSGSPKDLAIEVAAMAKTIHDIMLDYNEDMAQDYQINLFNSMFVAFENNQEEKKKMIEEHEKHMELIHKLRAIRDYVSGVAEEMKNDNESEIKDIRRAEFNSDEEFTNWFRGGEEDE